MVGGGDEEDPARELERLARDLAAIDARWASEGYQQRTSSRVLDDERKTRRELTRRIAQLRGLPPPLTPAAGTVALNVGSAWRPLAVSQAPAEKSGEPLPAFDVQGAEEEVPPPLEELERALHELLARTWGQESKLQPSIELGPMTKRFRKTPGAVRLLANAWRTLGRAEIAVDLRWSRPVVRDFEVREIRHPLLTEATEVPDEVTGLTPTQSVLMRTLRSCAPETGRFIPASEVLAEVQATDASIDEATFTREIALLGHPSLRRMPLVAFQGFSGRFTAEPRFTHVRLTPVGREVIDGTLPIPNLLVNGARGAGSCLLPMNPWEVAQSCLCVLESRSTWPAAARGFDLPDGTQTSPMGHFDAMRSGRWSVVRARGIVSPELSQSDLRCRVIITALPWPMTARDVSSEIESLAANGSLEGVIAVTDESSADEVRIAVELEHIAFLRPAEVALRHCRLFEAQYAIEPRVVSEGNVKVASLTDILQAFVDSRKAAAVTRLDREVERFKLEAQKAEAVCLALLMLERVQAVMRDALSDTEAEASLMSCMRDEDRAVLERLPFPRSHDYAPGFTAEQARHLVKKRKLASVPFEAARTDWMRALDAIESAKLLRDDSTEVTHLVRKEFWAAIERFSGEKRRSSFIY